ncbi:MAG: response regulator [Elusimicrobia bacterium]|nr:response regulator [Elusimicrobiota bacterium]
MKRAAGILVVDDEPGIRDLLSSELGAHGHRIATANTGAEALEQVSRGGFQLVISDVRMPRMGGLELLAAIKKRDPAIEVIISTGFGTVETAVRAMKDGAYDFIQKPFNVDELTMLVEKALEKSELRALLGVCQASKAIFTSIKLDTLLPIIAKTAAEVLRADDVAILMNDHAGRLSVGAVHGDRAHTAARLRLGERVAREAPFAAGPVLLAGPIAEDATLGSVIVFPLSLEGRSVGVLNANRTSDESPFTPADVRSATIFGAQIAQAIVNAGLYCELERRLAQVESMQAQLLLSEKLAAIGRLAAGVAHEINNPLTGILGFTELLLSDGALSPDQRDDLSKIMHQGLRCREIIKNLLQFGRQEESRRETVSLTDVLQPALRLIRGGFKAAGITLHADVPENLPPLFADGAQLEQVFLNILMNAQQALDGAPGGMVTIRARQERDRIVLRFEDNGPGIAPEHINRLFDPFFTTKPLGKGTGLGLSISHGIILQHQGVLRAESRLGAGATFIVELPVQAAEAVSSKRDGS